MANMKFIASLQTTLLEKDLLAEDGSVLFPKGTQLVFMPETIAGAILMDNGQTLSEIWPSVSLTSHVHDSYAEALAGYQAELIRFSDRLTNLERSTGDN